MWYKISYPRYNNLHTQYFKGEVALDQDPSCDQRTSNWLPSIEQFITSDKTAFIAVGVQHIIGENGIIQHFETHSDYEVEHVHIN